MLYAGFVHVLWNMMQDIIYKNNKLIMRDKLSKDSDDRIAANRLYTSAKKISHCCRKGSPFKKGFERSDIQGRQDVSGTHTEGRLKAGSSSVNFLLYINMLPLYMERQ
jgi:hypothetical protein